MKYIWFFLLFFKTLDATTALVAGGAGFLGSHLCEALLAQGKEVYCLDNCYTGCVDNVKQFSDLERFHFIEHDITQPLETSVTFDEIYNFACPASPPKYQARPIFTLKTNFTGTLNLLNIAKKNQAIFVQASTSEVYGDPLVHPQKEEYWGNVNPNGIRACYDEGKRVAETLCLEYYRVHNVRIKIARIFNTYGPRMDAEDGRVVTNFVNQALEGKPITIYGNGDQTRSFCYVKDLVEGILALSSSSDEVIGPINLGNPREMTVLELARKVIDLTQSSSEIIFYPLPQDDPVRRKPDISLANELLGWEPKTLLDNGLKSTIEYFTSRKSLDNS